MQSMNAAPPLAWITAVLLAVPLPAGAGAFDADPATGSIVVHAAKAGLLSGLAHDHRLVPERWRTEVSYDQAGSGAIEVRIVVDAASLRETTTRLGEASRAKVESEVASPDVLDAKKFPEIRVHATGVLAQAARGAGERAGSLQADLTLRGVTRPIVIPFQASPDEGGFHASGTVKFRQTDFGMTPFTTAMGTIGVDDELRIEFDLHLRPVVRPGSEALTSAPGAR
jgi:polyisoprenoid-binding protein YceI